MRPQCVLQLNSSKRCTASACWAKSTSRIQVLLDVPQRRRNVAERGWGSRGSTNGGKMLEKDWILRIVRHIFCQFCRIEERMTWVSKTVYVATVSGNSNSTSYRIRANHCGHGCHCAQNLARQLATKSNALGHGWPIKSAPLVGLRAYVVPILEHHCYFQRSQQNC